MRRTLIFLLLSAVMMAVRAQDRTFESCPLELIEENWKAKPIENVTNGRLATMLEAFDKTWPTYVVGEARAVMEQGLEKYVDPSDDTERTVINDARNGYVSVSDAGTDSEYMEACVWNRSNGRRLFAIRLGKPTDPEIEFVCFYDYEEYTWTLHPEPDILVGLPPKPRGALRYFSLPHEGKDLIVTDYFEGNRRVHTMTWNGMRPIYSGTVVKEGLSDE